MLLHYFESYWNVKNCLTILLKKGVFFFENVLPKIAKEKSHIKPLLQNQWVIVANTQ
jgi:hypothetical protein